MSLAAEIRKKWKPRRKDAHKGDFGRVFILAGSQGYTGAAHLTAMAALRTGAGLVTLGVPEKVYPILARREAEVMVRPFSFKSEKEILKFSKIQEILAMGPGLSQDPKIQKIIRKVAAKTSQPLVLDADGLNAIAKHVEILKKRRQTILTPHPGEFKRLFGKVSSSLTDRKKKALEAARKNGCVVLLKGHKTVIASPDGRVYVNTTGNPGMATGGTGDVLTGVIAALLGQKFSLWDAACFGAYLHGLAGDLAARKVGQVSLTAGDIIEFLPAAIRKVKGIR